MDQQIVNEFNGIIAHQAAQLRDKDIEIVRLQQAAGKLQEQLKAMAKELAALKEPKTDGSVSGKPAITHAQSLADLHGLPRPAADVTAEQFMRDNNIAQAANETPEPVRA